MGCGAETRFSGHFDGGKIARRTIHSNHVNSFISSWIGVCYLFNGTETELSGIINWQLTSSSTLKSQRRTNLIWIMNIWIFINLLCIGAVAILMRGRLSFAWICVQAAARVCVCVCCVYGDNGIYRIRCASFRSNQMSAFPAVRACVRANHFRNTHKLSANIYVGQIIIFVKLYAWPARTGCVRIPCEQRSRGPKENFRLKINTIKLCFLFY